MKLLKGSKSSKARPKAMTGGVHSVVQSLTGWTSGLACQFGPESRKLARSFDVTLDQLQGGLAVTEYVITVAAPVAVLTEVIFVKGVTAGTMGFHHQGTIF